MAEFQIRALVRRIDRAQTELRELGPGGHAARTGYRGHLQDDERRARRRALKRWLAADSEQLRALLSG